MSSDQQRNHFLTILCFGLVYFFWGSTYLAIRVSVKHIPPALMCTMRFGIAGIIMLSYCKIRGQSIRYPALQLAQLAVIGILLLMGGTLTLAYAEQYVRSGLAALLVAVTPLWFLMLDALLLKHHKISKRALVGLALGAVGTVVLLWPELTATSKLDHRELWYSLSLLGGSLCWALGSILSQRWQPGASPSASAWQLTFAGLANLLFALIDRDFSKAVWTTRGLSAVIYLAICGSLVAYTAYVWLLGHVPNSKVATYAYVNPVVAVFLGWLILKEPVDRYIFAGSAIVIASVILVSGAKVKAKTADEELSAA